MKRTGHTRRKWFAPLVLLAVLTLAGVLVIGKVNRTLKQQNLDRQLIAAVEDNRADQVTRLLQEGANANARKSASAPVSLRDVLLILFRERHSSPSEKTALMTALGRTYMSDVRYPDNTPVVKALLEAHADPNVPSDGETPLLQSVNGANSREVPFLLLQHGADPNGKNSAGKTCLMWTDNPDLLNALLKRGAQVDAQDNEGDTSLISQVDIYDNMTAMALLLSHGAAIDKKNRHGYTALREAVFWDRT